MNRGIFVTGTDTGVGKTVMACALIHSLRARGLQVHPFKPVAAGAVERDGEWINEDTLDLLTAAGLDRSRARAVTPILLREPVAPHIAARREGRAIAIETIEQAFREIQGSFAVVEGVGGFAVPLGDGVDTMELARRLRLPVVMVVGLRLGCLNHAILTAQAISASGLPMAGWIANAIDPTMTVADENVAALESRLGAPLLGRAPHRAKPDPRELAALLDVSPLLGRDAPPLLPELLV
jgi:dethiobiotin synthetase